jgi:hypothetical protein
MKRGNRRLVHEGAHIRENYRAINSSFRGAIYSPPKTDTSKVFPMSGTPSPRSPLASLVLFILTLALAASLFAAVHYVLIDMPQHQKALTPPENSDNRCGRDDCFHQCQIELGSLIRPCKEECIAKYPNHNWWLADTIALDICSGWCDDNIKNTACKEGCSNQFPC